MCGGRTEERESTSKSTRIEYALMKTLIGAEDHFKNFETSFWSVEQFLVQIAGANILRNWNLEFNM